MAGFFTLGISLLVATSFVVGDQDTQYGLDMIGKASRGACWYEKAKKLPPIDDQGTNYVSCNMNQYYNGTYAPMKKQMEDSTLQMNPGWTLDSLKSMIDGALNQQVQQTIQMKMGSLPQPYNDKCGPLVNQPDAQPTSDQSATLRDSGTYPYKAVAHCIVEEIGSLNGASAISETSDHINNPKDFFRETNDRENENRARHGVGSLKLDKELSKRAQSWADKLAADCNGMHHMQDVDPKSPDLKYRDGSLGENIMKGDISSMLSDAEWGLGAANGWYSEIKDYPWPVYNGYNTGATIGHFTQQVWKESSLVGYGIGYRSGCSQVFVVGRYYKQGNIQGFTPDETVKYYGENVQPLV